MEETPCICLFGGKKTRRYYVVMGMGEGVTDKRCSKCGVTQSAGGFSRHPRTRDGLQSQCKACQRAPVAPRVIRSCVLCEGDFLVSARSHQRYCGLSCRDRAAQLRAKYGVGPEEYAAMVSRSFGVCELCSGAFGERGPHLDHCHSTGRVRGLLCHWCNLALGNAKDDPERLYAMETYLLRDRDVLGGLLS